MALLALSDEQLDAVMRAAAPLQPRDRDPFLRNVAIALQQSSGEIGPGLLHRIVHEVQKRYFDPPLSADNHASKWRR